MVKAFILKFINLFRRLIGTNQIIFELQRNQKKQNEQLINLANAISSILADKEKIKNSMIYVRSASIVKLLTPQKLNDGNLIRIGKENDGGYVMLDNFNFRNADAAYSFGISNDVSWDTSIASIGVDIFMYDHTINSLPHNDKHFNFFKLGLTGHFKANNLRTINELIIQNSHEANSNMLMKMDIEGCEWDVFNEVDSETLDKFSQIVLEFHGLSPFLDETKFDLIVKCLEKINITHQSIHIHSNSDLPIPVIFGDIILPQLIEVTYIRKRDIINELVTNTNLYPTKIDQPTFFRAPDIYLGNFSID